MKSFKKILSEVAAPRSGDEKNFRDKHLVQVISHPVANDSQHTGDVGDGIIDPIDGKQKRIADYKKGKDMAVYENLNLADKNVDQRLERERQQEIRKKIIDEKKMDPVGQEDDDIDNDGDVDKSDSYLHNRRKAIKKAIKESLQEKVTEPYAVGMAAAMKSTGDTPPLKKSTIVKAHKIAKAVAKNEEVELDEADGRRIVDDLKSKGNHEEAGMMAHKHGLGRNYGPHFGMRSSKYSAETAFHKGYDKATAEAKKKNESVELDELSKKTLGSYIKKASHDLTGIQRGIISKMARGETDTDRLSDKRTFRKGGIARAVDRITKEEVELDEVSKSTLGRYVKAAATDTARKTSERDSVDHNYPNHSFGDRLGYKKELGKKINQRRVGISKAIDRLTKEEVELDEAFNAGSVKLKDGSSVILKKQDADLLNKMFKDLNAANRKKMTDVAMTDKSGFEEILGFAREAL